LGDRSLIDEAARIGHFQNGVKAGFFGPRIFVSPGFSPRARRIRKRKEPRMNADEKMKNVGEKDGWH